jgi:gamma-glutamylcyclotransferase (GGCT)/AIG2-like uncharacterized protein YtfP
VSLLVFVYGTLCDSAVFARVARARRPLLLARPAVLRGFRRVALRGTPYPTLLRAPGAAVAGKLLRVTPAQLARLHRYEGRAYRFRAVLARRFSTVFRAHAWIAANADPATPWP